MKVVCCICKKLKEETGWEEKVFEVEDKLSHGLCPDCYRRVLHKAEKFIPARETKKPA